MQQQPNVYPQVKFYRAATGDRVKTATGISIDPAILESLKSYAKAHHLSVSQVIEGSVAALLEQDNSNIVVSGDSAEGSEAPGGEE
jgi:hypothetical protein